MDITGSFKQFAFISIGIYVVILLMWLRSIKYEKKRLSKLYVRLLLVPFSILKNNIRIVNSFKDAIEYLDD